MAGAVPLSGLIVEFPEAEPVVGHLREALDVNARLGVPAHVTALFPFMAAAALDDAVMSTLQRCIGACVGFDAVFTSTAWFGDDVLWLRPEHSGPFTQLTERLVETFPDFPPFGGVFPDVVPHLTIAHGCDVAQMRAAERAVAPSLPIAGPVRHVTLMTQVEAGGAWRTRRRFPLGARADSSTG